MGKFFRSLKRAGSEFSEDDCMSNGAAIAYYAIFSLPPLLVLLISFAGHFGVTRDEVSEIAQRQWGVDASAAKPAAAEEGEPAPDGNAGAPKEEETADGAGARQRDASPFGMASRIVGILLLVFSATGLFAQLQYAVNRAWKVEPDPERGGVLPFVVKRVLSLGMIVVMAFLLLVSLVLTTLIDEIVRLIQGGTPDTIMVVLGVMLNNLAAFLVAMLLFAAMFKVLPDAKTAWRDIWIGAAVTAILFVVGKEAIGWYMKNSDLESGWGAAAGSLIGVLVWIYYSSLILLFGAEVTQVWAREYGAGIKPAKGAVHIERTKRVWREGESRGGPHGPATGKDWVSQTRQ